MKYRSGASRPSAASEHGKFLRLAVWPINQRRLRGRQNFRTSVVGGIVHRSRRVKHRPDCLRGVIKFCVGEIAADKIWPAEVARPTGLIDFVIATRTARPITTGIRSDFA